MGDWRWMCSKVDVLYFVMEFWNFVGLTGIYCDEILGYPIIYNNNNIIIESVVPLGT
jgi:hypothetical protein